MSEQPVEGFAFPIPEALLAKIKERMDHVDMHREDFSNQLDDLIKTMPLDQLSTLVTMLSMISGNTKKAAIVASYFEGMTTTALLFRQPDDELQLLPVQRHLFKEAKDLDNPYCAVCNLPPANQVHRK